MTESVVVPPCGPAIVTGASVYSFLLGLLVAAVSGFAWGVGFLFAYVLLHHFDLVKL